MPLMSFIDRRRFDGRDDMMRSPPASANMMSMSSLSIDAAKLAINLRRHAAASPASIVLGVSLRALDQSIASSRRVMALYFIAGGTARASRWLISRRARVVAFVGDVLNGVIDSARRFIFGRYGLISEAACLIRHVIICVSVMPSTPISSYGEKPKRYWRAFRRRRERYPRSI